MNSEIALNYIGQALMAGRDNTPLGVSEEKDFRSFHKSLQYFHLAWLREDIKNLYQRHNKKTKFPLNDYLLTLRRLVRCNKKVFELWWPASRRAYRELIIHTTPEIHIKVEGTKRIPHIQITDDYNFVVYDSTNGKLYPTEIYKLFSNIDTKLKERSQDIIIGGLKDVVPECLKSYFIRGKFTKDMGNSCFSDGSFSIGHEIRLVASDTHDMAYSYIPDFFWNDDCMKRTFENVQYSYWALMEISSRLPKEVEFICQHRDDCGVMLTNENPSSIDEKELLRRKAVLMAHKEQQGHTMEHQDYMDILSYCGLNESISISDFINMCSGDFNKLHNHEYVIKEQIGAYFDEVSLVFNPNSISIFLLKNRNSTWSRECFLRFPYGSNLSFLKDIDYYLEKAKELTNVFEKNGDTETSVGLLKSTSNTFIK